MIFNLHLIVIEKRYIYEQQIQSSSQTIYKQGFVIIIKELMGKKKDKQRMIEEARMQRKLDKQMKMKLRKKMAKGDAFKLTKEYFQYFKAFNNQILPLKIMLKDVAGDGNCLFRSFADQIDGKEVSHIFMRDQACNFMVKNQQFFRPFLDEDEDGTFENYIKAMRKSGQWGGHLQLQALSQCFKCIIIIHKRNLEEVNVRPITEDPKDIIHLAYFQHQDFQHYTSVRFLNDQSQAPGMVGLANLNKNMYNFMLYDDPEQFLLRQQLEEMDIKDYQQKEEEEQGQIEQQEPYPNYPRNKKCKCGSKIDYKSCCFKQWQKRRQKRLMQY